MKEFSSTQVFELGNGQVQVVNLHHTFQPAKGANGKPISVDAHLDSMYNDYHKQPQNVYPLSELVSRIDITGKYPLPKEFIAIIQS